MIDINQLVSFFFEPMSTAEEVLPAAWFDLTDLPETPATVLTLAHKLAGDKIKLSLIANAYDTPEWNVETRDAMIERYLAL